MRSPTGDRKLEENKMGHKTEKCFAWGDMKDMLEVLGYLGDA
jgi:hypothetical protein